MVQVFKTRADLNRFTQNVSRGNPKLIWCIQGSQTAKVKTKILHLSLSLEVPQQWGGEQAVANKG
jgi:tRNA 2-selenouridine synthase SelU